MPKRDSMVTIIAKALWVKHMNIQSITAPEFMKKDDQICYCVRYVNRFGEKSFVILRGPNLELIYHVPVEHLGKMYHDLAVWFNDVCDKHLSQSKAAQILGYSQAYICIKHKEFCNVLAKNRFVKADELVEGTNYEVYDRNFEIKGTVRFAGIDSHGDFIFFKQIYSSICDAWILTPADWTMTEEYASNLYFKAVLAKDRNAEAIENRYFCKEISKVLRVDVDRIVSFTSPEFMVKDGVKCYCVQYATRFGDKYFAIFRGPALELIYKAPVEHLGKMYHDLAVWVSDVCDKHLSQSKAAKMLGCSQPYICMKHKEFCNILSENGFIDADKLVEGKKYDIYDIDFEKKK